LPFKQLTEMVQESVFANLSKYALVSHIVVKIAVYSFDRIF